MDTGYYYKDSDPACERRDWRVWDPHGENETPPDEKARKVVQVVSVTVIWSLSIKSTSRLDCALCRQFKITVKLCAVQSRWSWPALTDPSDSIIIQRQAADSAGTGSTRLPVRRGNIVTGVRCQAMPASCGFTDLSVSQCWLQIFSRQAIYWQHIQYIGNTSLATHQKRREELFELDHSKNPSRATAQWRILQSTREYILTSSSTRSCRKCCQPAMSNSKRKSRTLREQVDRGAVQRCSPEHRLSILHYLHVSHWWHTSPCESSTCCSRRGGGTNSALPASQVNFHESLPALPPDGVALQLQQGSCSVKGRFWVHKKKKSVCAWWRACSTWLV